MKPGPSATDPADGIAPLLAALGDDPERAAARYEQLRARLCDFFRWRGAPDADVLADRTFDRVGDKLASGVTIDSDDPGRYVLAVARYIYMESAKQAARERRAAHAEAAAASADGDGIDPVAVERRAAALDGCLDGLSAGDRGHLLRYHRGEGSGRIQTRRQLADELGINLNTLRIRMHRLRQRIEDCVRRKIDEMDRAAPPPRGEPARKR